MVRAKEPGQRMKLMHILKSGEFPCRRLFLDYHGLRLIHGWMTDAQQMAQADPKLEYLRLETLQTLETLPIPNKTMLQESKVLLTVEKWSKDDLSIVSPMDSESNSPKIEVESNRDVKKSSESVEKKEEKSEEKTEDGQDGKKIVRNVEEEMSNIFNEDMDISPISYDEKEEKDNSQEVFIVSHTAL